MRIKVLMNSKKGATNLLDKHFDLVRDLVTRYPNALWRKVKDKNGQVGYELEV